MILRDEDIESPRHHRLIALALDEVEVVMTEVEPRRWEGVEERRGEKEDKEGDLDLPLVDGFDGALEAKEGEKEPYERDE
ncbi:hypothetical protein BHE74_00039943 [Ensete ventricosum]|nr:hypothetical protein GW17_00044544 [Ensete ventricosum]RWW53583.1 hypothetical protein BHE74_00039943 [Ensete ventricosum]